MNEVVSVVADNCVLLTSVLVVLLSLLLALLCRRKSTQTGASETFADEFLLEDTQSRSKKAVKSKPKKTKSEKVWFFSVVY